MIPSSDCIETSRVMEGDMFISPLIFLIPVITCMTSPIFASASKSRFIFAESELSRGKIACIIEPLVSGSLLNISSVTKGIMGCSKTSVSCKTRQSTLNVFFFLSSPSLPYNTGLIASRYQSQNSCHTNLYSAPAASLNR